MIEQASLIIGDGNWAVKSDSLLGYALPQGKYTPREMSVVRATTGTRVNAAGLVEVVPYNLLTYSEQFDNADWLKVNSTVTGGQNGYDGTTNAFLITDNSTSGAHLISQTPTVSGQHTISIYAKANTLDWVWLRGVQSSANVRAWFNLSTGTIGTVETNGTANIESVGNGWYRCSLTIANHQSGFEFYYGVANANATTNYVGSGQSIFVQDAQLVEGSNALDYLPTTTRLNIARIDYSTGSPALLVEPQRTNIITYSEQFDNAAWIKADVTTAASSEISPSGIANSEIISETNITSSFVFASNTITYLASTKYSLSIYAKWDAACTRNIHIRLGNCPSVNIGASFDKNGNFVNFTGGSNGTLDSYSSTDVGNGWWRFEVNITTAAISSAGFGAVVYYLDGTNLTYAGSTTQKINWWGAQLELGSYPTSYIPTTSASVTRNADVVSKTGITSLIGQTEGTIFFDGVINGCQNAFANLFNTEKNTTAAISIAYVKADEDINVSWFVSGTTLAIVGGNIAVGQMAKIAFAYKSGNSTVYINGVQIGTDTTVFTFPSTLDDIFIGDPVTYFAFQESISNNVTAIFKTRLTNAELAALTTI
jgi:hypothetical protein